MRHRTNTSNSNSRLPVHKKCAQVGLPVQRCYNRILRFGLIVSCFITFSFHIFYYYYTQYEEESTMKGVSFRFERNNAPLNMDVTRAFITYSGLDGIDTLFYNHWHELFFCEINQIRDTYSNPLLPITINITFSSTELYNKCELGTGNLIEILYGIRLLPYLYESVEVYIVDTDNITQTKGTFILPWLTGYIPSQRPLDLILVDTENKPTRNVCGTVQPITRLHTDMQYDLRRMAIALVGTIPYHSSQYFVKDQLHWESSVNDDIDSSNNNGGGGSVTKPIFHAPLTTMIHAIPTPQITDEPIYPNVFRNNDDLDDVTIHFRCGDIMDSVHAGMAFQRFGGFIKLIPNITDSTTIQIGIVTQPFDDDEDDEIDNNNNNTITTTTMNDKLHIRRKDDKQAVKDRCRIVVQSFVQYIYAKVTNVRNVRIYNDVHETIALTYARMIFTKQQVIIGISSFPTFAAIASFASHGAYVRLPTTVPGPNYWLMYHLHYITTSGAINVVLYDDPDIISVSDMKSLWETEGKGEAAVLEWFWG
jgi:hypothetical protein